MHLGTLTICILYGFISVMNNLSNKLLISQYKLPPFFLLLIQELLTVLMFPLLKTSMNRSLLLKTLPLACFFIGNLVLGLIGMKYVNLPMYVCLRKMTTLIIYIISIYQKKKTTIGISIGVCFITFGGIIAGINDITGGIFGYIIVLGSVTMNVMQLIYSNILYDQGIKSIDIFFSINISVLPFIIVCNYLFEYNSYEIYENILGNNLAYCIILIGSCSSALASFMMVLCSSQVSPMATSITGNFKDIATMFIGLIAFNDTKITFPFTTGLISSTLGAIIYSYSKLIEN